MNEAVDTKLETPCPNCGEKLLSVRNYDPKKLFVGITKYMIYCESCDFEETEQYFQKRLSEK